MILARRRLIFFCIFRVHNFFRYIFHLAPRFGGGWRSVEQKFLYRSPYASLNDQKLHSGRYREEDLSVLCEVWINSVLTFDTFMRSHNRSLEIILRPNLAVPFSAMHLPLRRRGLELECPAGTRPAEEFRGV